ncbi:MAG: rod shape-determining protein MreD [Phycisphaerales bacterium]|nr:rod shape-determining protein MreD [Phycisphaerales bacterium]
MRWWAYAILAYLALGIEVSLRPVVEIGETGVSPSIIIIFAVIIALYAPGRIAVWACLILGLAIDLTNMPRMTDGGGSLVVIGPYALGYTLAAYLLLQVRMMVIRRNAITLAFCVLIAATFVQVVVMAFMTVRGWMDPLAWDLSHELLMRLLIAVYSALLALPCAAASPFIVAALSLPPQGVRWSQRR